MSRSHRWAALVVLCASALIVNVDNTILNVALPTLVRKLPATSSELQWIVDSYAMVFAGLLLVGGSLADRFGRKRFFLIGLAVFAAGSIGAAFSGSVDLLIAWRAVMGAGAALTIPASLSIINDVFRDPAERARAIGAWAGTIGLGIAIGPIAGGLLLARFWWGSIFLVNVPIVVAAFAGALLLVPDSKNPAADPPGSRRGGAVDRRPRPAAVGDHRGSDQGWGSAERGRGRAGQPRRPRRLRRLGGPQPPPDAEAGVLLRPPVLGGRSGRVPRGLRAAGRAVRADPVPAVRPRATRPCRPGCASCPSPPCSA